MRTLTTRKDGAIGIIEFSNPPYNFMTSEMVRELDRVTGEWEGDSEVRAVILTSAVPGVFIAHYEIADILKMFVPLQRTPAFLRGVNTAVCLLLGRLLRGLAR